MARIQRRTIKKDLHNPDNHDGMITHLEPDILECKVKSSLGSINTNKASGGDGISAELFQILKDDAVKVLHSVCQQKWKTAFSPVFCDAHSQGFSIVNKAEVGVFLELSCFFDDPTDVGNLISGSSAFSKTSLNIWKFTVHVRLKPGLKNFEHYFTRV